MSVTAPNRLRVGLERLARENRIRPDPVPDALGGIPVRRGEQRLIGDQYLLRTHAGLGVHYVLGEGIAVESPPEVDPIEVGLWLKGSVYCAVAAINGFVPVHASAIACEGEVHAFTGPSGAGKSTLIAALGAEGLPMFCDDTLVLDLADAAEIWCLPGHKRLKLKPDSIDATGAAGQGLVGAATGKSYVAPTAGSAVEPMPLARLYALAVSDEVEIAEMSGAERLAQLNDEHYTSELLALARGFDRTQRFAFLTELAERMPLARLGMPFDLSRLPGSAKAIAATIRKSCGQ